ncbi:MAG: NAD(P)/FAD-dependent oxidoreductase [Beijerinckiaceae bacterium]
MLASSNPRAGVSRRDFARFLGAAAAAAPFGGAAAQTSSAKPRIVIAGAGAAGVSMASRLSRLLPGATITIVDARKEHLYQPGFSLVAAGVYRASDVVDDTGRHLPRSVKWVQEFVAEFDPDGKSVTTTSGQKIGYDFLVVTTGLKLDFESVEGMDRNLIGREGIASVYASPQSAAACFGQVAQFYEKGGVGLFGRPRTEMKCAGAPLKFTMIAEDRARAAGKRQNAKFVYYTPFTNLFSVEPVHHRLLGIFKDRGIDAAYDHDLVAIDPVRKIAKFKTPVGQEEMQYDFIHLVPPQRAPDAIRNSPLPWRTGNLAADGWVETNRDTMQHARYPEIFVVGDIAGVPRGKTAASVKWQAPVAAANLLSVVEGKPMRETYNGYTSCPMITAIGKAMLIEFDYAGKLTPSFPFIDPLQENWIAWAMKEQALKPMYYAMLGGRV